jgi:Family of unknown function (DUF6551)
MTLAPDFHFDDDRRQTLDWVLLGNLRIPRYQRKNIGNIDKLVATWDPLGCGALTVSERDQTLWIVDGQRRAQAARRRGINMLGAVILHGLTEEEEAGIFLNINRDRLRVSAVARHRAEAVYGEPRAIEIDRVLADHELAVVESSVRSNDTGFFAFPSVVAAERVYDDGGAVLLDRTIGVVVNAYPDERGRLQGSLVAGLGYFLARDPWTADDERVIRALSKAGTSRLYQTALNWQSAVTGKGSTSVAPLYVARAVASAVYGSKAERWQPGPSEE